MPPIGAAAALVVLVAGYLAGAQLGKAAQVIGWLSETHQLSFSEAGWIASLIGLFVAAAAIPASGFIRRAGLARSFALGSALTVLGGLLFGLSGSVSGLVAGRVVEALGYVLLVIAAPGLLALLAKERLRGAYLALWGGFVPVGYAIAGGVFSVLSPYSGEATILTVITLLFAVVAVVSLPLLRDRIAAESGSGVAGLPAGASLGLAWRAVGSLAVAFGLFVVLSISLFNFLPTQLSSLGLDGPGVSGLVSLAVPAGTVVAGVAIRRGADPARIALIGLVLMALPLIPAGLAGIPAGVVGAAAVFALGNGVASAGIFAAVPPLADARGADTTLGFGLVAQAGGIGTVIGPPAMGAAIDVLGWEGACIALLPVALAAVAFAVAARRAAAAPA